MVKLIDKQNKGKKQLKEREVYCEETNTMDFSSRRVTDIPTCRRTIPPQPLPPEETTILTNLKSRLKGVTKTYIKDRCDRNGNLKKNNLTREEAEGIKSIKKKVREEEWMVVQSDKSKRMTANTKQNYLKRLNAHTEGDTDVSLEEEKKIEREMNATTLQLARILRLGGKWNGSGQHWQRIKSALRTKSCWIPSLYGLTKDHKASPPGEEELGPPLRPVCGATESANGALSEMLTEILTKVAEEADKECFSCTSNEELMATLTEVNKKEMKKPVVLSMDVKSMYPNLKIDKVADIAASEFLEADLKIEVDKKELGLYLAIIFQGKRREDLVTLGLDEVVPRRKHPRAKTVLISTEEVLNRKDEGETESKFLEAERQPTEAETRQMFGLALKELIKICMKSHTYSIGMVHKLQSDGGPIGLKISGAVGRVFMTNWCKKFKRRMEAVTADLVDFTIHAYKFYVDDHNLVVEELPPGARLVGDKVEVVDDQVEDDDRSPADRRTAELMKEVANSICKDTTMEVQQCGRVAPRPRQQNED